MLSAYFGQKAMNNFLVSDSEMKLKIQLCVVESEDFSKKENIFEQSTERIMEKYIIPYQKNPNSQLEMVTIR